MGPLAAFGIKDDGLNLAVNLLLLFIVVIWLALIFWTYSDAKRRMTDRLLIGCATAASAFPIIGAVIYMIVRPPEYLEDARERDLEIAAAEARLAARDELACPYCDFAIERTFLRCPSCLRRLREPCTTCGKPLDPRWKICPYCEAEIGSRPDGKGRRSSRAASSARSVSGQAAVAGSTAVAEEPPAARSRSVGS